MPLINIFSEYKLSNATYSGGNKMLIYRKMHRVFDVTAFFVSQFKVSFPMDSAENRIPINGNVYPIFDGKLPWIYFTVTLAL